MRRWLMRFLGRPEMTAEERQRRMDAADAHDARALRRADLALQKHREIVATYRAMDSRLTRR